MMLRRPSSRAKVWLRSTRGASLVEYIVVLGCVALLAIVGFQQFGVALYSKSRTFGDNVTNLTPVQGGSSYCFVAGTLVATPDGERPIEEIRAGDRVLTRDERSGEVTVRRAIATSITPDARLVEVRIR